MEWESQLSSIVEWKSIDSKIKMYYNSKQCYETLF